MSAAREILIEFASRAALDEEVAGGLSAGAAFGRGAREISEGEECTVILVHPDSGQRLSLPALAVWIADDGVGLALRDFDRDLLERIRRFANPISKSAVGIRFFKKRDDVPASSPPSSARSVPTPSPTDDGDVLELLPAAAAEPVVDPAKEDQVTDSKPAEPRRRGGAGDVQKRVRGLSGAGQQKLAKTGDQTERVALERVYGKSVWETLLRNPRISQPEVARIARKGTVPRPLIEIIVDNSGWLNSPQIRRALLSNPRLSRELVEKVLRASPRSELRLMPKQTSYPKSVREIAARMLG